MTDLKESSEIKEYVLNRDRRKCQFPGCESADEIGVLFLAYQEDPQRKSMRYENGVTVCQRHKELISLHEELFLPLITSLIQLIEYEKELERLGNSLQALTQSRR